MASPQEQVKQVMALTADPEGRTRVESAIKSKALPEMQQKLAALGRSGNGWTAPTIVGNYKDDYLVRTLVNLIGIWANNSGEVIYFKTDTDGTGAKINGDQSYSLTFPADDLPMGKAKYFWSVIAVDSSKFQVLPNPKNRFLLNKESGVKRNADGSITLHFGAEQPNNAPEQNWLPTPKGTAYNLTFRFYRPTDDLVQGKYFPPPLTRK